MKELNVQAFSRLLLTSLCSVAFLAAPSKGAAECCYQQPDNCCEQQDDCCGSGWGRTALLVGGAIVAGGIAGAIAGNSHGGHHHHHHSGSCSCSDGATGATGPTGATGADGSNPFEVDETAVLTFTLPIDGLVLTVLGDDAATGNILATAFVSTPDGVVIDGSSQSVAPVVVDADTTYTFTTDLEVTVPEGTVVFGTYHPGIHLDTSSISTTATDILVEPDLNAPFVDIETDGLPGPEETVTLSPLDFPATSPATSDIQAETEYTYDPENPNLINP